jgi:hypothetical protein
VDTPGTTYSEIMSSTSAAMRPATRIFAMSLSFLSLITMVRF